MLRTEFLFHIYSWCCTVLFEFTVCLTLWPHGRVYVVLGHTIMFARPNNKHTTWMVSVPILFFLFIPLFHVALSYILCWCWGPSKFSPVPPQEENLRCHEAEIKKKSIPQIRETNDPVAKCFKMSLHVYLEGFGVTSTTSENKAGNALSVSHDGLQSFWEWNCPDFCCTPFPWNPSECTRGLDSSRKNNRTHKWVLQWLPLPMTFSCGFPSEIWKPAHLGGYGYRCLPGGHQETHTSLYCKSTHCVNKTIHMSPVLSSKNIAFCVSVFLQFGPNGYYFAIDPNGYVLLHPNLQPLVGRIMLLNLFSWIIYT